MSVITTPLGFFALSLLIVEGFLGIILIGSGLSGSQKFAGLFMGAGLFLLVVLVVTILVWFRPQQLTFSEGSHLAHERFLGAKDDQLTPTQLEELPKETEEETQKAPKQRRATR